MLNILPPEDPARQSLLRAQFNQDTQATAVHLHNLLQAYLKARTAVVQRLHLLTGLCVHAEDEGVVRRLRRGRLHASRIFQIAG